MTEKLITLLLILGMAVFMGIFGYIYYTTMGF